MDPTTMMALSSLISGGGSLLGGLFGGKSDKPGFGTTNIDEIGSLLSMFGFEGSRVPKEWDLPKQSLAGALGEANLRDMPQFEALYKMAQGTMPFGNKLLGGMTDMARTNTARAQAMATQTRTRPLAALEGGYDAVKASISRDLPRQIMDIFAQANAGAAARGVKSQGTGITAGDKGRRVAESVFDRLAGVGMREAETKAGYESQAANAGLNTTMQRGMAEENINSNVINTLLGLRGGQIQTLLQLMQARRGMETEPIRAALDTVRSMPASGVQPSMSGSFASNLGGALGNIGSLLGGFAGFQAGQQQQAQQQQLLNMLLMGQTGGPMYGMV